MLHACTHIVGSIVITSEGDFSLMMYYEILNRHYPSIWLLTHFNSLNVVLLFFEIIQGVFQFLFGFHLVQSCFGIFCVF